MFCFLLAFSQCMSFGKMVKVLTSRNWDTEINQRSNITVYIVMFHGERCPACQMAYPNFIEAAKSSTSTIKFGELDTSSEYQIASKFNIRGIPTFITFHPGGQAEYRGDRSPRSFLNTVYKYVPNLAQPANESWSELNRSVILFSDKKSVPPLWKAVSCHFHNTSVQIGFSSDQEILDHFKIKILPTILMISNGTKYVYPGKNSFQDIRSSIVDFFHGKIKPPTPRPPLTIPVNQIESEEEFKETCKGHGKYCVVMSQAEEASQSFKDIAKKYRNDPFKFFLCGEKCPIDFTKSKKGFWIIHQKRDAAIIADTEESLKADLDRVIGGDARFTPISKLLDNSDL